METIIHCSDQFIHDLVLCTVESYYFGTGERPNAQHPSREVYGHIWGHSRVVEGAQMRFVRLEKLQLTLSAKRKSGEVTPNADAFRSSIDIMGRLAPDLCLLGDFHTHPYPEVSVSDVKASKLYEFSPSDHDSFDNDDLLWEATGDQPLTTVATICELKRIGRTQGVTEIAANVASFDIGQFRIWFNVACGLIDSVGDRASVDEQDVTLNLERRLLNPPGLGLSMLA